LSNRSEKDDTIKSLLRLKETRCAVLSANDAEMNKNGKEHKKGAIEKITDYLFVIVKI